MRACWATSTWREIKRNRQALDKIVKGLLVNGSQILSSGETLKAINA